MEKTPKEYEYAQLIIGAINEMFDEDAEGTFKVSIKELSQGKNATHFTHALASIAPNYIINKLTGIDTPLLEFNHNANTLIFQYYKLKNK